MAVGGAPGTVARALGYIRGLQRSDGSVAYSRSSTQTPVWVTAQALLAFRRAALPVATAPLKPRPKSTGSASPRDAGAPGGSGGAAAPGRRAGEERTPRAGTAAGGGAGGGGARPSARARPASATTPGAPPG